MKTRNGFVSNSSSSSFTCDICGESFSGMDMGLSDFELIRCENQHTICESHARAEEPTVEMKREYLIKRLKNYTWKKPEELAKDREEILAMTENRVEARYNDYSYEGGHQCRCPICNFEKLDVSEGLRFLLKKSGMTSEQLAQQMGQEFKTYDMFLDYITPPKQ